MSRTGRRGQGHPEPRLPTAHLNGPQRYLPLHPQDGCPVEKAGQPWPRLPPGRCSLWGRAVARGPFAWTRWGQVQPEPQWPPFAPGPWERGPRACHCRGGTQVPHCYWVAWLLEAVGAALQLGQGCRGGGHRLLIVWSKQSSGYWRQTGRGRKGEAPSSLGRWPGPWGPPYTSQAPRPLCATSHCLTGAPTFLGWKHPELEVQRRAHL